MNIFLMVLLNVQSILPTDAKSFYCGGSDDRVLRKTMTLCARNAIAEASAMQTTRKTMPSGLRRGSLQASLDSDASVSPPGAEMDLQ